MLNNSDDPALLYLSVGTEVSAKFKGAFCEAKIKRVDKSVKCKITYKQSGLQATVSDELIRSATGELLAPNEFKIGSQIGVVKTSTIDSEFNSEPLRAATLNKIIDNSSYTVIFNDGDEKVVRRNFIRFKGEKHYLDSETLNNAPLNNPEHFLYPIKNNVDSVKPAVKLLANTDEESGDEDLYEDAASIGTNATSETVGKSSKTLSRQATKKNLKSAVNTQEEVDHYEETPPKEAPKVESSGSEDAESGSDEESSSSDDFPCEIKDRFVAQLYKFMDDRGTPMNRVPTITNIDIDLHRFFIAVRRYGGYNKVCKLRAWTDVYKRLGLPNMISANVSNLKSAYKR